MYTERMGLERGTTVQWKEINMAIPAEWLTPDADLSLCHMFCPLTADLGNDTIKLRSVGPAKRHRPRDARLCRPCHREAESKDHCL